MRPSPAPPPEFSSRKKSWLFETRVVLITRLFGGGAKTREIDRIFWLRSSAAKSVMRGWWRAAHAHEFKSLAALRERENELFGAPGTFDANGKLHGGPGPLEVFTQSRLAMEPTDYNEPLSNPLNYALFPAQGMGQARAKVALASDQSWSEIKLTSPSLDDTLHGTYLEALRLWLTLGGVGSRTRRGAGAVAAASREEASKLGLPGSLQELEVFLRKYCKRGTVPEAVAAVFCLAQTRRVFVGRTQPTGEEAQKKLLAVIRGARQDRPRPRANQWGRSRWPEADAIRLKADPQREWTHAPERDNAEQYPRAALGLPIVVHFKDRPPVEPPEHQILAAKPEGREWKKLERYSSPILLRPVRVWNGNGALYVPVAIFTDCTFPADYRPLVTTDPKGEVKTADVVRSYSIRDHAEEALRRIETAFETDSDFRAL